MFGGLLSMSDKSGLRSAESRRRYLAVYDHARSLSPVPSASVLRRGSSPDHIQGHRGCITRRRPALRRPLLPTSKPPECKPSNRLEIGRSRSGKPCATAEADANHDRHRGGCDRAAVTGRVRAAGGQHHVVRRAAGRYRRRRRREQCGIGCAGGLDLRCLA